MNDLIDRQTAIEAIGEKSDEIYKTKQKGATYPHDDFFQGMAYAENVVKQLPSAQPDERMLHESCTDCPLYDKDRHSCPRFNKVIPVTLRELQSAQPEQRWIPWSSGKLPEESGTYTVTAYDGATKRVTYAKYQKRLKRWELTGARAYWRVLAWMPLPPAYHADEESNA